MKKYNQKQSIYLHLRRLHSRSPTVREVLNESVHPLIKGPRGGKRYICKSCGQAYGAKDVQVDHIDPVVPLNVHVKDMFYQEIIDRMFCEKENLQVLCKPCHKIKTNKERKERLK